MHNMGNVFAELGMDLLWQNVPGISLHDAVMSGFCNNAEQFCGWRKMQECRNATADCDEDQDEGYFHQSCNPVIRY